MRHRPDKTKWKEPKGRSGACRDTTSAPMLPSPAPRYSKSTIPMRIYFLLALLSVVSSCSDTATSEAPKAPPKAPEPITGRMAFQRTFPTARTWSPDCQPLRIHSLILDQVKAEDGKSGAWEVTYVSAQLGKARTYTWSAVEAGGNLHEGVFAGPVESWSGPQGQEHPFLPAAIAIDSTDALQTAIASSKKYLAS